MPYGLRRLLVAIAVTVGAAGCTTSVVPPSAVSNGAAVAIVDHGRHASLVVEAVGEAGNTAMVRYAYGDRQWFALRQIGMSEAGVALLLPSPGVLGRRRLPGPMTEAGIDRAISVTIEEIHLLTVEADDAAALIARLDAIFVAAPEPPIVNDAYGLDFVRHPADYSLAHNSNRVVSAWLEALGCTVTGPRLWSRWRVEEPG